MTPFKWLLVAASALLIPAHAEDGTGMGSQLTARTNQSLGTPTGTDLVKVYRGQNGDPVFGLVSSLLGAAAVSAVSNSDGTLTFSPTTGAVVGSLALGHANIWTGAQTFGEVLGAVTTQSGTTYTFAATDCGTEVVFSNAGAITATIPATLPVGCNISILQTGAGKVSVNGSAVAAATLHTHVASSAAVGTAGQWAVIGVNIYSNAGGSSAIAILTGDGS